MDRINPDVPWNSGSHLNTELFVVEPTPGSPVLCKKKSYWFQNCFQITSASNKINCMNFKHYISLAVSIID